MARLLISYSLSYDWLVRGRPNEDWREPHEEGLAYQAAVRAAWEPYDEAVFAAFASFGLRCWEAWPAYPVHLPDGATAFKDPLTFHISDDWDDVRCVLIHELCHVHEDHPANRARYEAILAHIRAVFPDEEEGVQYHLITCTLQRAMLMRVFPDRWQSMVARAKGHPILDRAWALIEQREAAIDWQDPMTSLVTLT